MNKNAGKWIFLADDDEDDCLLFGDALMAVAENALLTTVSDGFELMHLLREQQPAAPDIIFLDLNMPRKNGFECLHEMQQFPQFRNIPVVIYSTSAQQQDIDRVYQQGARYYLCKPDSFEELKKAISNVLSIDWHQHQQPPL
ncbi:response regulator [Deminuibacter soli]|uniref:Response regulator n=1 Tax=Deminuibacter soli TaxID=2291815 RepID=A0A3E1NF05_9BACT|nr:response regulator [Deminuibacter soli]RFM26384.1 response regulator [Deminuibacter soli]